MASWITHTSSSRGGSKRRIPDLHFEIVASTLVINYRNQKGGLVNEVLMFEGHGTYLLG
ncbi:hypothetical protein [Amycolatopsis acididurans]|uniref:hypothetical protein n=1 Tax=Amycolatopsis acididurans TaxID=2724524 RepID=UPI001FE3BB34|nr:hypothetical protein [Amycolatopsis acididurans]